MHMNQKLMQRYGLSRYIPNNLNNSSPTCCDRLINSRQSRGDDALSCRDTEVPDPIMSLIP